MRSKDRRLALGFLAVGVVSLAVAAWGWTHRPPGRAPRNPGARADAPNFLVIDVDNFSWDHVGVIRDGVSNTPEIDGLAARGVRFTQAYTHSGWTLPALSSLLSGALPVPTRAVADTVPWYPPGTRDVTEVLATHGYATAAFFGARLAGTAPFARRFGEAHVERLAQGVAGQAPRTEEVLDFLDRAQEPFFALVHDANLHDTWLYDRDDPTDPLPDPTGDPDAVLYSRIYTKLAGTLGESAARDAIVRHYDHMASRYDAAIGSILRRLEEDGLADHTVVIFTADHGDDFFEHANVSHGLLYDSIVHVPLVVVDPASPRHGVDEATPVQLSDVAPTMLVRAGITPAAMMTGHSLAPLLGEGGAPYVPTPVFSITSACHASWRDGSYKLVLREETGSEEWYPAGGRNGVRVTLDSYLREHPVPGAVTPACARGGAPLLELYDLAADPHEQTNLIAERAPLAAPLLGRLLMTLDARRRAIADVPGEALPPDQIARMRAQGYWGLVDPSADGAHAPGEGAAP